MADEEKYRQRLAYHEAGHVVIARALGLGCSAVSIVADADSAAHCTIRDPYEIMGDWDEQGKWRPYVSALRGRIIAYLAGRESEDECLGPLPSGDEYGDDDDQYSVSLMLESFGVDETAPLEKKFRVKTRGLVRRHRASIETIATELLKSDSLSAEEVDTLLINLGDPLPNA